MWFALLFLLFATAFPAFGDAGSNRAQADALFGTAQVLQLRLDVSPEGLRSLRRDPRKYVPAILSEGDAVYTNVIVHLRGSAGSFRPVNDKPGLTIKIEKGGERFHGLKKFHLNNSVQDSTYLSEWICNDLFRSAGVPALRAAHALVELNGRRVGLYVCKESFNKDFLARYFRSPKGNLYGESGGADINHPLHRMQGGGEDTHSDLRALAAATQEKDPAKAWQRLEEVLDVDRFLSFMAMEVMLCHHDGYTYATHNYRIYQDVDTGKMVFFPHDMDQMMGDANSPIIPRTGALVPRAVLRSPDGRTRFRERFTFLYTNVFQAPVLISRIDQYVAALMPSLREYDPQLADQFRANSKHLQARIRNRALALEKQVNPPKPLQFEEGFAQLQGWRRYNRQGKASLEETSADGHPVLTIASPEGGCSASWRATVLLEPGRYRFSGRASFSGVAPQPDAPQSGVVLRVAHGQRKDGCVGDADGKLIQREFSVEAGQEETVLVCELHASAGEVSFEKDSLRLERVP